MTALTATQIEAIKKIKTPWMPKLHGNTKTYNGLPVELFREIVEKKRKRDYISYVNQSDFEKFRTCLKLALDAKGTNYFKIMIEGSTGIYFAHPYHQHNDYNKYRVWDKNEKTLKLMRIFNSIVNK